MKDVSGADQHKENEASLSTCLRLGCLLFRSGASTQRIIDSVNHAARSFGDPREIHVLAEYDALLVSASDGKSERMRISQSKGFAGIDVSALISVSRLVRELPKDGASPESISLELHKIGSAGHIYGIIALTVAAMMANIGFGLLNGADVPALFAIAPAAAWVFLLRRSMLKHDFNLYASTLLAVCSGGIVASLLSSLAGSSTPEAAFIAPMLFLVPGLPFINGGVDIFRNHNSMGLSRVAFTFMVVATITLGLAFAMTICPLPSIKCAASEAYGWIQKACGSTLWAALAAVGLAMLNNAPKRTLAAFALCGAAGRLGRELCVHMGADIAGGTLAGAAIATATAIILERKFSVPAYIFAVVGVLPMVPGLFAIKGLEGVFSMAASHAAPDPFEATAALQTFLKASFISSALVAGIIFPIMITDRRRSRI